MISTHTVVQLGQQDANVKHEASVDADGYLGLYRRQSSTEADVAIVVSFHGRPDRVLDELRLMVRVAEEAACTGLTYAVNSDAPEEGFDVVHHRACPVHRDAVVVPSLAEAS